MFSHVKGLLFKNYLIRSFKDCFKLINDNLRMKQSVRAFKRNTSNTTSNTTTFVVSVPKQLEPIYNFGSKGRDKLLKEFHIWRNDRQILKSRFFRIMIVGFATVGMIYGGKKLPESRKRKGRTYVNNCDVIEGMFYGGVVGAISGYFWPVVPFALPVYGIYKVLELKD